MEADLTQKIQEMIWNISNKNYAAADKNLKSITTQKVNDLYKAEYKAIAEKMNSSVNQENIQIK